MGDEDGGHQNGSVRAGGDASSSPEATGIREEGGTPSSSATTEAAPPSAEPVIAASRWSECDGAWR